MILMMEASTAKITDSLDQGFDSVTSSFGQVISMLSEGFDRLRITVT